MNTDDTLIFREEQRFFQWWLSLLFAAAIAGAAFALGAGLVREGEEGLTVWETVVGSLGLGVGVATFILFVVFTCTTEVRTGGLYVRLFPLHLSWRTIDLAAVVRCEAVTYRPIREYGGWGIRRTWSGDGWAYNVSGNRGVRIDYADGTHLLIGSQRPEELAQAIQSLLDQAQ